MDIFIILIANPICVLVILTIFWLVRICKNKNHERENLINA